MGKTLLEGLPHSLDHHGYDDDDKDLQSAED